MINIIDRIWRHCKRSSQNSSLPAITSYFKLIDNEGLINTNGYANWYD